MDNARRAKNWCFTFFFLEEEARALELLLASGADVPDPHPVWDDPHVLAAMYQLERAPDTHRLHLQGFACFRGALRLATVKSIIGDRAHLEPMRGTIQHNEIYCGKERSHVAGPWVHGDLPKHQGRRTDLEDCVRWIVETKPTENEIARSEYAHMLVKYPAGITKLKRAIRRPAHWRTLQVIWYWGTTGIGKTRRALHEAGGPEMCHIVHSDGQWWDGYDGQSTIIFDDLDVNQYKLSYFKRLLDGHPLTCPVKGDFTVAMWTRVFITSQHTPDWYFASYEAEDRAALWRRVTHVEHMEVPWVPPLAEDIQLSDCELPFDPNVPD